MNFIKLALDQSYGNYCYKQASNIPMNILGNFLLSDVRGSISLFREWALDDKEKEGSKFNYSIGGNITFLEEDNGYIFLADGIEGKPSRVRLKMTISQFVQILDEWEEKVCKKNPKEVMIKHEGDKFWIETSE